MRPRRTTRPGPGGHFHRTSEAGDHAGPAAGLTSPPGRLEATVSVGAAIDVGSNSVHLLVAAVADHRIQTLVDESVFLGLGDRVRSSATIGPELLERHVAAVGAYVETARRLRATSVLVAGTEAVRRAADAARLVRDVESSVGVPMYVLEHHEEGLLTFLGVTAGSRLDANVVVVDIGGGSSEFVTARPGERPVAHGLRIGSATLTAQHVEHDPPIPTESAALHAAARAAVRTIIPTPGSEVIAVGGTASNLLRVLEPLSTAGQLSRAAVRSAMMHLTADPSELAVTRYGVNPVRARLLPAGAAIVLAIMDRYGVDRITVADAGLREGLVLAGSRAAMGWRDQLPRLVLGWPS